MEPADALRGRLDAALRPPGAGPGGHGAERLLRHGHGHAHGEPKAAAAEQVEVKALCLEPPGHAPGARGLHILIRVILIDISRFI